MFRYKFFLLFLAIMSFTVANAQDDIYYEQNNNSTTTPRPSRPTSPQVQSYDPQQTQQQPSYNNNQYNQQQNNNQQQYSQNPQYNSQPNNGGGSGDYYEYPDEYDDYAYGTRIQRFHRPYSGFDYYDNAYVDNYYQDPYYYNNYSYAPSFRVSYSPFGFWDRWSWLNPFSFGGGWGNRYNSGYNFYNNAVWSPFSPYCYNSYSSFYPSYYGGYNGFNNYYAGSHYYYPYYNGNASTYVLGSGVSTNPKGVVYGTRRATGLSEPIGPSGIRGVNTNTTNTPVNGRHFSGTNGSVNSNGFTNNNTARFSAPQQAHGNYSTVPSEITPNAQRSNRVLNNGFAPQNNAAANNSIQNRSSANDRPARILSAPSNNNYNGGFSAPNQTQRSYSVPQQQRNYSAPQQQQQRNYSAPQQQQQQQQRSYSAPQQQQQRSYSAPQQHSAPPAQSSSHSSGGGSNNHSSGGRH